MARDYKSRQEQPRRRRRGGGSCFFWFLTGGLLGALGVAMAWMMEGIKDNADNEPAETAQQAAQPIPRPRFDYHSILPEMEVVVPDDELIDHPPALPPPPKPEQVVTDPKSARAPSQASAPTSASQPKPVPPSPKPTATEQKAQGGSSYLLQVASFKSPADAERLKAKLAFLGMTTRIQQVTINGKDTYHRVRAGPYRGKDALNKARALLSSKGLESMAIKLK